VDAALRNRARDARGRAISGVLRGEALLECILDVPSRDRDDWVDALLGIDGVPEDVLDLPRGAVPYLPSGVEEIVAMAREIPLKPDDELVDIGSGLGRVVILAHLLSGARAVGIEIQEHLVRAARVSAAELGLDAVSFVHANAAEGALDGSVFFLYAPCNGEMLERVVGRLEAAARRRRIVVCAVGVELHDAPFLALRSRCTPAMALYDSR
jgi:SAM-dependent methyltransferase